MRLSFEAHVPCKCVDCADRFGDQADDDREPGSVTLSSKERKFVLKMLQSSDTFDRVELVALIRRLS